LKSNDSTDSYVSAVSSSGDLLEGKDLVDGMMDHGNLRPLVEPGLLSAYSAHMQSVKCINWRQNIPNGLRKKFSLLKNLKVKFFVINCFGTNLCCLYMDALQLEFNVQFKQYK